jgi:hypothetical protein
MGALSTRHSLRPLLILGEDFLAKLGRIAPRECGLAPRPGLSVVVRRSFSEGGKPGDDTERNLKNE